VPLNAALDGVSLEGVFNASNAASRWLYVAGFLFEEEEEEAVLLDMIAREIEEYRASCLREVRRRVDGVLQSKDEVGKEAEKTGPFLILYSCTGTTNDATCVQTPGIQQ
jgi:hypothetical protein